MKSHMKCLRAPNTWGLLRKENVFTTNPNPGAHPLRLGMAVSTVFKRLGIVETTRECKKLLQAKEVLVDGKRVRDHRRLVGFMDLISLPETKEVYRVLLNQKGRLVASKVVAKESSQKLSKVTGKKVIGKDKIQINLGSRNILLKENKYKVGDSLLLEVPSQKVLESFSLDKGNAILIIGGKHIGEQGILERVGGQRILFKNEEGKLITTLKQYAFILGKSNPAINMKNE